MISTQTSGLAAERLERIRCIVQQRGAARVDELEAELRVSTATIRRDLIALARRGWLRRVHGGAVCMESRLAEPLFDDKAVLAADEKARIARAALKLINTNDSVFLDGGSTVLALAALLTDRSALTVVTNSLRVAGLLSGAAPRLILAGGEFRQLSQTFVGSMTRPLLEQLQVDTAFMGTIGLSAARGLTTTDPREAYTKELVMRHARRVIMLADSTKIGKTSFVKFGAVPELDALITDRGAARRALQAVRKQGVKVVTC